MEHDTFVEIHHCITAPPERVFDHLVDETLGSLWTGYKVKFDVRPGGYWEAHLGAGIKTWGRYIDIQRPNRLTLTWACSVEKGTEVPPGVGMTHEDTSVIEFVLRCAGGSTILTFTHRGFHPLEPTKAGWDHFLDGLASIFDKT